MYYVITKGNFLSGSLLKVITKGRTQNKDDPLGAIFILRKDIGVGGLETGNFSLLLCSKNVLS